MEGMYTVNQPMKHTKDQPLTIEPLQLCTNHKPNTKSAVIEKHDTSVSIIVAIIEKTTFFKQYSALTRLQRTATYCLRLFHNAKNSVASDKKKLQQWHHLAFRTISTNPQRSMGSCSKIDESPVEKRCPDF
jgi:hypothetical protein